MNSAFNTLSSGNIDLTPDVSDADHRIGAKKPSFVLVQYGDYECPFTAGSHWQMELLLKNFPSSFHFVFRHFPLQKKHLFAMRAAEAVEAAAAQGKFWQMHGALLRHDYTLGLEGLKAAAQFLGLDLNRFELELQNHSHREKIKAHINSGIRSGVASTPAYFVNGVYYEGPDNYDDFAALIRSLPSK